jgi:curved DNA-binding protein CbpA
LDSDASNYYSLLGVKRRANADDIKRAYRKLVFQYHPDRNPDNDEAADKLKQIMEAYDVLSSDEKRASYDRANWAAFQEQEEESETKEEPSNDGFRFSYQYQQKIEPEPRCPKCAVMGMEHVVSRKSGSGPARGKQFIASPFQIIFCDQCGHVYGVAGASG